MDAVNIFRTKSPEGRIDVARAVRSTATAMFLYDLAPGQSSSPYHYEYEEEWLLVVDGRPHGRAQADEQDGVAGENADVLELASAGRQRLPGQRQDRRLARRRGRRADLRTRERRALVVRRGRLGARGLTEVPATSGQ